MSASTLKSMVLKRIRRFWYAAPMKLAERWEEFELPIWAGVMGVDLETENIWESYKCFRPAVTNREAPKMTILEKAHLARLGTIRIWTKKS